MDLHLYDYYIFDFDGTMADTYLYRWAARRSLLSIFNFDLTDDVVKGYIGLTDLEFFNKVSVDYNLSLPIVQLCSYLPKLYVSLAVWDNIPMFPMVRAMVNLGKVNLILSTESMHVMEGLLSFWNLKKRFSLIYSLQNQFSHAHMLEGMFGKYKHKVVYFTDKPSIVASVRSHGIACCPVKNSYSSLFFKEEPFVLDVLTLPYSNLNC